MKAFRKWISYAVIAAFAVMMMPAVCHAAMSVDTCCLQLTKDAKAKPSGDCQEAAKQISAKKDSGDKQPPAGKSSCANCLNHSCGGTASILNADDSGLMWSMPRKTPFSYAEEDPLSGLLSRIKRPPRA